MDDNYSLASFAFLYNYAKDSDETMSFHAETFPHTERLTIHRIPICSFSSITAVKTPHELAACELVSKARALTLNDNTSSASVCQPFLWVILNVATSKDTQQVTLERSIVEHAGGVVWNSSVALADLLFESFCKRTVGDGLLSPLQQLPDNPVVLELGAGVGLLGPVYRFVCRAKKVILSDSSFDSLTLSFRTQRLNDGPASHEPADEVDDSRVLWAGRKLLPGRDDKRRDGDIGSTAWTCDVNPDVVVRHLDWHTVSPSGTAHEFSKTINASCIPTTGDRCLGTDMDAFKWRQTDVEIINGVLYDFAAIDSFANLVYKLLRLNPQALCLLAHDERLNVPFSAVGVDVAQDVFLEHFMDSYVKEVIPCADRERPYIMKRHQVMLTVLLHRVTTSRTHSCRFQVFRGRGSSFNRSLLLCELCSRWILWNRSLRQNPVMEAICLLPQHSAVMPMITIKA
eukprot:GHVQ01017605.1.p1 GENE.GHVQ01017605.1~~GHVQ01017605.1.p1  ORF type:complete len:457 (+),score=20.39 GHVQ01017605.1:141-1511(+)